MKGARACISLSGKIQINILFSCGVKLFVYRYKITGQLRYYSKFILFQNRKKYMHARTNLMNDAILQ